MNLIGAIVLFGRGPHGGRSNVLHLHVGSGAVLYPVIAVVGITFMSVAAWLFAQLFYLRTRCNVFEEITLQYAVADTNAKQGLVSSWIQLAGPKWSTLHLVIAVPIAGPVLLFAVSAIATAGVVLIHIPAK